MMDNHLSDRLILDWDESDVQSWLTSLGYPQYEPQIREHRISGDALCMMDPEGLKGLGVATIGQRLAILKAVYLVKVEQKVPIDADHYIPPSEAADRLENVSSEKLHSMVKEQAQRLQTLEEDNRNLHSQLQSFMEEFNLLQASLGKTEENSNLRRQPSFKWGEFVKPSKSPTKLDMIESPHPSPQQMEHDIPPPRTSSQQQVAAIPSSSSKPQAPTTLTDSPNLSQSTPKTSKQDSDNLKSFKVSLEDPTYKVLPAALKKYRINNDDWQNYAMFICYGSTGNRIERCLSYDEKPLLLFQKLKDARKNPVFMLKHIKDIRSPIAVAQQKHAARKASSIMTTDTSVTAATQGHSKTPSTSRALHRPPKLEVQDLTPPVPPLTGVTPQSGWPEPGALSPSADNARPDDLSTVPASAIASNPPLSLAHGAIANQQSASNGSAEKQRGTGGEEINNTHGTSRGVPIASTSGVSYAVAIYPYMAEQDDEFDVVVGDTFVILSRARGWWVVQRDPNGSGIVDTDIVKQGWVPAGCLLETNVPVASAIAEATAAKGNGTGTPPHSPVSRTPILPLSIISTSFPGVALMDYKKKGDEELDLVKDDALRVFKRYNHWSYAVKEEGGDRGWVPSWFIGKVSPVGNVPSTPNTIGPTLPHTSLVADESSGPAQVSPMSSAFPPVHSRATPVQ